MTTITNVAYSMSKKMKPRVNNYKLLTDYTTLAPDGINTMLGEYSVVFEDTKDNIETLDSVLVSLNSTAQFEWNPYSTFLPLSETKKFICNEWETSYEDTNRSTLTATFIEQPIS